MTTTTHTPSPVPPGIEPDSTEAQLYERLRLWRLKKARERGVSAYLVLTNRSLREVVKRRPQDLASLGFVFGFGPLKVENHGPGLLEELTRACEELGLKTQPLTCRLPKEPEPQVA